MDIAELGITKEELQERLVEKLAECLLNERIFDQYGEESSEPSHLGERLRKMVKDRIDQRIQEMADQHILPKVSDFIENVALCETNKWGEKKGKTKTFIEYMTERAEAYLLEKVDYNGKTDDSYGSKNQTRITYMIHHHLQYSISSAMEKALKDLNASIAGGLAETARQKLQEITKKLKFDVQV